VVEAVVGLQKVAVVEDLPSPTTLESSATHGAEFADAPLQQPAATEAADFVRATAAAPVRELNAATAPSDSGWTGGVAHQMESLASHLKALGAGHKPSESAVLADRPDVPEVNSKDVMADAVAQMERAYMLAIETTMASRGSTEATKIFNTLLKGQ
jgi:hypothetical protein